MKQVVSNFIFLFLLFAFNSFAGDIKKNEPQSTIKFTENKNQWDTKILYRAQLDGGALFLQKNCFTYNFYDKEMLRKNHIKSHPSPHKGRENQHTSEAEVLTGSSSSAPGRSAGSAIPSHAFRMTFLNCQETVETAAKQATPDYCNFFIGNNKNKWAGNVKNYTEVNYQTIYNGIDLQVLGLQNSLKYNFFIAPTGNPDNIQLFYEGLDKIKIEKGALKLTTSITEIVEQRPYAYQLINGTQVEVPCEFILKNTTVSFHFPRGYNKEVELVIDPVLVFAASSGSSADNFGMSATYDSDGNLYSGGTCFAQGFPTTLGAYDVTYNGVVQPGRTDVVVTKYDATGVSLIYSTYLGGANSTETVSSLIVNAQNELMLTGVTGSNDFPVTAGAYDITFNGGVYLNYAPNGTEYINGSDLYVARFNAAGSSLLSSTYIGGSLNDGINSSGSLVYNYGDYYRGEIQLDAYSNCYISSCTRSADFPTTPGSAQPISGGAIDGVVFKMDAALSTLLWSTYLGGTADDACYAVALDDSSNVYVTGGTASSNFPVTTGALSTVYNGGISDGFITKIKKDGTSFLRSTFIGTSSLDQSFFIQLDKDNDVYIIGQTLGVMPVSSGVYSNANSKQFIWKLNNLLSTQIFTTVFGNGNGNINISPAAFLVDHCENIYVSGWGGHILTGVPTNNMPLTGNAIQPTTDGFNFYLFVLSTDAVSLLYATYLGGAQSQEHVDGGTSRFDKRGIIYQSVCAGCGGNDDFPVSPGAWPNTGTNVNHSSNCNNGVFKFDFQVPIVNANFIINYTNGCAPLTVGFNNQSTVGSTFLWDFGGGDTTSVIVNPTITYTVPGTYLVQLYVNDPSTCNAVDTAYQFITVYPPSETNFDFVISPCTNQVAFYDSSAVAAASWLWYFDDGDSSIVQNPQHTYTATGAYDVQLISSTINGCRDTAIVQVNFFETLPISVSPSATICKENTTQLTATGGFAYSWAPLTDLSNPSISNPLAGPDATTTYTVTVSTLNGAGDTCIQTATVLVTVSPSPTMTSASSVAICNGGTVNIPLTGNVNATYSWIAADNINTTGESTTTQTGSILNNTITNPTSSVETVTYTVTPTSSPQGCLGTPQTVSVAVNPSPAMTSPASATICNGNTVNITLTSDQASAYEWIASDNANTTGESLTSQTGSTLSNTIFNNTIVVQTISYTVTPTSSPQSCAGAPQTVTVTLTPSPTMTIANTVTICDGAAVNIPLTSTMPSTYTWIAADNANTIGESTTLQNDSLLNNTITNTSTSIQSVIYTVTPSLISGTCAGIAQTVTVTVIPPPTISSPSSAAICSGETITIPLTSNVNSSFSWIAADNPNTTGESITTQTGSPLINTLVNNTASIQTVTYTVTPTSSPDGCAGVPQTLTATVYVNIVADFDFVKIPCTNQVTFYDSSAVAPVTWLWYFDDGDSSMLQNPSHTYGTAGTYNVQLIASTINGCADTVIVQVDFAPAIPVVVSINDTICKGNNTSLIASGGFAYLWTPSQSLSNAAISNPIASPDTTTTYTVSISTVDIFGDTCIRDLSTTVFVIDPSLYSIFATTDNDTLIEGQSTIIHAITDTTLAVNWLPLIGLSSSTAFNPTITPQSTTTYIVSILDSLGCPRTASVTVYVMSKECDPTDVFVPNTFTPNGDGANDILYVRGNEITELYFAVYNRWGELVFQTSDIKKGWEGTYNGLKADPAVFAWYISAKCFNGGELKKKGNVTLVR